MNNLDISERLVFGKAKEEEILENLNKINPLIYLRNGNIFKAKEWISSSHDEDVKDKIDAWAYNDLEKKSVQIKYRVSGSDLGVAVWRPFYGLKHFRKTFEIPENRGEWYDRDFTTIPDFYVRYLEEFKCFSITEGWWVHHICNQLLDALYETPDYIVDLPSSRFQIEGKSGAEIRVVTDQGEGYSKGQQKLIVYIQGKLLGDVYRF